MLALAGLKIFNSVSDLTEEKKRIWNLKTHWKGKKRFASVIKKNDWKFSPQIFQNETLGTTFFDNIMKIDFDDMNIMRKKFS